SSDLTRAPRARPTCRSRSAEQDGVTPIPFAKGHGLGNDYIVMSRQDLPFDLSEASIVRICDRNWGIGSDGILMQVETRRADFGLRIFNPDGSEAEKSGTGLRI